MKYKPETPFQICGDNRLVYNLHHEKTRPWSTDMCLVNDVCVSIEARHLTEETQAEIAQTICDALNKKYPIGHKQVKAEKWRRMNDEQKLKLRVIAERIKSTMQCNCDLDIWAPEQSTGHSWVCRIHKTAMAEYDRKDK